MKCKLRSLCTIFAVAPFDGKYTKSYLLIIVMFAMSLTVSEFAKQEKCKILTLKMKVKIKE